MAFYYRTLGPKYFLFRVSVHDYGCSFRTHDLQTSRKYRTFIERTRRKIKKRDTFRGNKMNPISKLKFFLGPGMFRHTINMSILAAICWVALIQFPEWKFLGYPLWISLILVSTIVIWRAGDFFSPGAEYIPVSYTHLTLPTKA